ncbi:MAG: sulfatase [Balneolales bacterium]
MRCKYILLLLLSVNFFITVKASGLPTLSEKDDPPNVLFITIDDLRNDLGALGVDHIQTPNLDAFAEQGRLFSRHYVQVPTCGSSRAALMRGMRADMPVYLPNTAIADTHEDWGDRSLPAWFRQHGYQTLSLGKITHYPGGLTGESWAEGPEELPGAWDRSWIPESPWETPEDMMHGFANGQPRDRGTSPTWESHNGPDTSYPDSWVASEAIDVLDELSQDDDPWFFAVGFFKPHLPFAAPKKYFDLYDQVQIPAPEDTAKQPSPSSWHGSGEMMGNYGQHPGDPRTDKDYANQLRHAYAAATSYVDAQVGRLLDSIGQSNLDENTIIVIWGDHGFALGEQGIWGKHSLYEVGLKAPLIIRYPGMNNPGQPSNAIVETVDLFPTLTDLTNLPTPEGLHGESLREQLEDYQASSNKAAYAHWNRGQTTVRDENWRLIEHRADDEVQGYELFDFRGNNDGQRRDAGNHPDVVKELLRKLAIQ